MGMAVLELLKSWECGVILGFDVAWWCLMKVIELTWVDSLIVEWWWFQYVSVWSHCLILFVSFKLFLTTTYYDSALAKKNIRHMFGSWTFGLGKRWYKVASETHASLALIRCGSSQESVSPRASLWLYCHLSWPQEHRPLAHQSKLPSSYMCV